MIARSIGREAVALAASGHVVEALALLDQGCADGEGEALFARGLWRIDGRFLSRDVAAARSDFRAASLAGYRDAGRVYSGFLAMGAGGPCDWTEALQTLDAWAARDPIAAKQSALIAQMDIDAKGLPNALPRGEALPDSPKGIWIRHLCTPAECALLVELASPRMQPALIFHEAQKKFVRDPLRDSEAAGFPLVTELPFVTAINRRIAAASNTDYLQGEPLQILRYNPGQQYRPHLDAIAGLSNQRCWTALIYLNDDYEGGETAFLETGAKVRGNIGDMLLFANATADGRPDPASRHAGCPVTTGTKLLASRWIRAKPSDAPHSGFGQHEVEQT